MWLRVGEAPASSATVTYATAGIIAAALAMFLLSG
jgi:hypothetical protein